MAEKPFSKEELNFLKFASIVLGEFPKTLRQTFRTMWDRKISGLPGYQVWDDSSAVRCQLLNSEGGKTKIPTTKSINEWDCSALFQATIYSKTFGLTTSSSTKSTTSTLANQYLPKGKLPGHFHSSVISPTGNQDETFTLAIDQLRLLRNTLCHISEPVMNKTVFDQYVQLAKDASAAIGVSVVRIDYIGLLKEDDFPTEKVNEINERIKTENNKFLQEEVLENLYDIKSNVTDQTRGKDEILQKLSDVQDCQRTVLEKLEENKAQAAGLVISLPESCVPPLVPHFIGRDEECEKAVKSMLSQSTRMFSIWGSPGFGKTSTAIAIANLLKSHGFVYYFTFRGETTIQSFISKLRSFFTPPTFDTDDTPGDALIRFFRSTSVRCFIILDNLDDVLSTMTCEGGYSVTDKVLSFMLEVLQVCKNMVFLTTSRSSLEFLSHKISGVSRFRLGPLEPTFSKSLVVQYLPSATTETTSRIANICGNIPLAIRMLCALMIDCDENAMEVFLDEIHSGPESLLDVIDGPGNLSDMSLKQLFEMASEKLSEEEKRVLVLLTGHGAADFDIKLATVVLKKTRVQTTKILKFLEQKSLIEFNENSKKYSIHPLIQSFVKDKIKSDPTYEDEAETRRISILADVLRQIGDSII